MTPVKRQRGRPLGTGLGATSLTGKIFEALAIGESATFTRDADLSNTLDATNWTHNIGSYAARRLPGASFKYESFLAITAQSRAIVGVILTRES
jgi:hypothetical protein